MDRPIRRKTGRGYLDPLRPPRTSAIRADVHGLAADLSGQAMGRTIGSLRDGTNQDQRAGEDRLSRRPSQYACYRAISTVRLPWLDESSLLNAKPGLRAGSQLFGSFRYHPIQFLPIKPMRPIQPMTPALHHPFILPQKKPFIFPRSEWFDRRSERTL